MVAETAGVAADQLGGVLFSEADRVGSYAGEIPLGDPDAPRRSLDALAARREFQHAAVVNRSGTVVMVAGAYSEATADRTGSTLIGNYILLTYNANAGSAEGNARTPGEGAVS